MLQQLRLEFGDKSHKSCKNTYAPLYSVTRTFTDGGVLMSRVTFTISQLISQMGQHSC